MGAYLGHGLVETEILEDLDPTEEHSTCNDVIVLLLPEPKSLKVSILRGRIHKTLFVRSCEVMVVSNPIVVMNHYSVIK